MIGYVPVNQDDIPESRHAIFIRGFPADMPTDRIRDFFEDQIGHCTLDFVKQSPDGTKLFLALRFDEKEDARECMERYNESNVLGHRVSFQWFRDIRRYIAYHQSRRTLPQGLPPPPPYRGRGGPPFPPFRGRGGFSRGGYENSRFPRGRGGYYGGRGRPPPRYNPNSSYDRFRSRSPSRHRSRSRSRDRGRTPPSDSSTPRTRSVDRTPESQRGGRDSTERRSPSPEDVVKKSKKHRKHKKKREGPVTPEGSPDSKRRRDDSEPYSPAPSPPPPPPPPLPPSRVPKVSKDTLESRRLELVRKGQGPSTPVSVLSKVVTVGDNSLLPPSPPTFSIRFTPDPLQDAPLSSSRASAVINEPMRSVDRQVVFLAPGSSVDSNVQPTSIVIKKEIRNSTIANPVQVFMANIKTFHTAFMNELKEDVDEIKRLQPAVKKESGLKLSTVTKQGLVEAERKQKISKLSPAQVQMVNAKQKDMDSSYQLYCDTFASVLKILTDQDAELAASTESAKNGVLADHKSQLSAELDEFIELLMQS